MILTPFFFAGCRNVICCHVPAILKSYFPSLWEEDGNSGIKINGQSRNMRVFLDAFNRKEKVADVRNYQLSGTFPWKRC